MTLIDCLHVSRELCLLGPGAVCGSQFMLNYISAL